MAVRSTDVIKWHWGLSHQKFQIWDYQNKDWLSSCCTSTKTFEWPNYDRSAAGWSQPGP